MDSLDDEPLMQYLEKRRGRGRNEYPVRVLWNCLLAMIVFGRHVICDFIREMNRNYNLRKVVGLDMNKELTAVPRTYVFSRFFKLLRTTEAEHMIKEMFDGLVEELGELLPEFGKVLPYEKPLTKMVMYGYILYNGKRNRVMLWSNLSGITIAWLNYRRYCRWR